MRLEQRPRQGPRCPVRAGDYSRQEAGAPQRARDQNPWTQAAGVGATSICLSSWLLCLTFRDLPGRSLPPAVSTDLLREKLGSADAPWLG